MAKRSYKMTARLDKAYENYKMLYKKKEESLARRNLKMADDRMLTFSEYKMNRNAQIEAGRTTNINKTIVSEQAFQYSTETAKRFKATAKKFDLDWQNKSLAALRTGEIDPSGINETLKEEFPDWTGRQRQEYISYEVFGSD